MPPLPRLREAPPTRPSCPGSQYWGRVFTKTGHEVRILPAQFVKPYLKANKNDFNDAEAIADAARAGGFGKRARS